MDGGEGNVTSEDESATGKPPAFCYWWWRSVAEFDSAGRADGRLYPATAAELTGLSPRQRVLKEMERLALVGHDSLDDLRHKLLSYRAGDLWVPAGGVPKEALDVPPVVTILLVGAAGSGKSSLVNLMYSVLGRSGLIPFARTSSEKNGGTSCLEEHNVLRSTRNGFCVYDSKGFEYDEAAEGIEEMAGWVEDGVRHRQPCGGAAELEARFRFAGPPARFAKRRVNSVIVVANLAEIYRAQKGGDTRPLNATRALFHSPSLRAVAENPILALTHGDMLAAEERIEARLMVCEMLGVSEATGAYDIACLNEYGLLVDEFDSVTAYSLAEAVYRSLLAADRSHPPKRKLTEWLFHAVACFMWSLSAFCAFLSFCFSSLARRQRCKLKIV
ncbi:unnamed protein product [Spirodela intermedia]|uniref:Uncharacterized protein n=1 Tax=Spirodela intermedia TaxID=51605 RepID=A0A7I8JYN5_SPIIN|nr:unnamed protein product [Spirodela intermedia]